ncbi:MAG: hypothetical protein C0490_08355 [Marivirga sp.]|nr:hypothetical protein [Marivirga sp.]
MRIIFFALLLPFYGVVLMSCSVKVTEDTNPTFTKTDSLTDSYLAYQDSMLQSWNVMINDDNQKIKSMHNLLHELIVTSADERDKLEQFEEQLDQLERLRYTQKSMGNADVVEEYDFASTTLVQELISLAESKTEFAYNTTLQKLVDDIRTADQRVDGYREEYDAIATKFNRFLDKYQGDLKEITHKDSLEKKPLFRMAIVE